MDLNILNIPFSNDIHFICFYKNSLGSVIKPFIADAATVAGEDKNIFASALPILPGKLRLEVDIQASPGAKTPS